MYNRASSLIKSGLAIWRKGNGCRCLLGVLAVSGLMTFHHAQAKDFSQVDGEWGTLHVTGALSQGACRLEMESAYQQVQLGTIVTGDLARVGQRGEATPFQLILRDCLLSGGRQRDSLTQGSVWDSRQPVVSVSFIAPADTASPDLVKVDGAQGIGLRLLDSRMRDVRLGSRSEPRFIAPYHDALTWYVLPERTVAPLVAGAFNATLNFRLNYD